MNQAIIRQCLPRCKARSLPAAQRSVSAAHARRLVATPLPSTCLLFRRNDRQQQIGRFSTGEMQGGDAVEHSRRAVARIVVQERPAAGQFVLEVRQLAAAGAAINVILAADRQRRCDSRPAPRSRSARSRCRAPPARPWRAAASCRACDRAGRASTVSCRACGARRAASLARRACADRWRPGTPLPSCRR